MPQQGYFVGLGEALSVLAGAIAFVCLLMLASRSLRRRREAKKRLETPLPPVVYNMVVHADPPYRPHRKVPRPSDKEIKQLTDEISLRRRGRPRPKDIN